MKKRWLLVGGLLVAAAATSISFASSLSAGDITVSATAQSFVNVATATTTGKFGSPVPAISPVPNAVGTISSGDLYTITPAASNATGDMLVTVYLKNPADLAKNYNYMNINLHVYLGTTTNGTTTWSDATPISGSNTSQTAVLSLNNGYVTFALPGLSPGQTYSISVDGGSYYCVSTASNVAGPAFSVNVQPFNG